MINALTAELIDADALCQIAEDAIEQDLATGMTDGLVMARGKIESLVTKALDRAMSEALDRHVTPRPVEQIAAENNVVPHITAAQIARDSHVLRVVGQRLRESEQ